MMKQCTALALSLLLLFCALSAPALAGEAQPVPPTAEENGPAAELAALLAAAEDDAGPRRPEPGAAVVAAESTDEFNPVFLGTYTPEQMAAMEIAGDGEEESQRLYASGEFVTTVEEAGALLRAGLTAYQKYNTVYWRIPRAIYEEYDNDTFWTLVWDKAMEVTENGLEGDYLSFSWWHRRVDTTATSSMDGSYVFLTITYTVTYTSTAAQNREMAAKADETIGDFGFTHQTSAYDKICAIYDYVAQNIRYTDSQNVDTALYHSAYSAIVMKETVCQGYSTLLYYMFWRCEIPCRIIEGNNFNHAWNLVWLRGRWYSLDVTWDNDESSLRHDYFLCGSKGQFYDSHTPSRSGTHAICGELVDASSPADYGVRRAEDEGACAAHTNAATTYTTDRGCTCYWCSVCGQSAVAPFGTWRIVDRGQCGDGLFWSLDSDGLLTITGSGDMWDSRIIWYPHRNCVLSVSFPAGMTGIGDLAFEDCEYLGSVELPAGLTRIGTGAFAGCGALEYVFWDGTPAQWDALRIGEYNEPLLRATITFFGETDEWSYLFFDGMAMILGYTGAGGGVCVPAELGGCTVVGIVGEALAGSAALETLSLPESLVFIGEGAFRDCTALRAVSLHANGAAIEDGAFAGCDALRDVCFVGEGADWSDLEIGGGNDALASAARHAVADESAGILGAYVDDSAPDAPVCRVLVYCAAGEDAAAFTARYAADGRMLAAVPNALAPDAVTELAVPCDAATDLRFFVVGAGGAPLCESAAA